MAKSVSKPVPKVPLLPGVPATSRRRQYSASTRRALLEIAEKLFAEHGYAGTSLDAIVAGAQVTKGALYHHFSGKQALYEAVFEQVETESARRIQQLVTDIEDPWEKARTGLCGFLDIVRDPIYRRIVIQDGPASRWPPRPTPSWRRSASRPRSASSSPASRRWPTRAWRSPRPRRTDGDTPPSRSGTQVSRRLARRPCMP
jgi:AcrR family transcriptional regulator